MREKGKGETNKKKRESKEERMPQCRTSSKHMFEGLGLGEKVKSTEMRRGVLKEYHIFALYLLASFCYPLLVALSFVYFLHLVCFVHFVSLCQSLLLFEWFVVYCHER